MSELNEKVQKSVERMKAFEDVARRHADDGTEGYYLAFSGGKDSVVIKALADLAGVPYDAHYTVTSVDPPELVRFIKEKHPDVILDFPKWKYGENEGKRITMWNLIPKRRMPPTRIARFCCQYLKEDGGDGRMCITGVRWAESPNRRKNQGIVTVASAGKKMQRELLDNENFAETKRGGVVLVNDNEEARQMIDACVTRHKTVLNPIIDWEDKDVWEFIKAEKIPYCELYDEGFTRLGCIGCPMAKRHGREREFLRWPKYKRAYIRAFQKMLDARKERGLQNQMEWNTGKDVFNWWMEYDVLPGQMDLLEEEEDD